ncbi:stage II sporulation protein M [Halosimplex sp. TS25]|uniref:stage II sporulation protein M n=1 Tax=Halosimplex rarum TaxID=3396619 RepID=UPI0039EBCFA8
MSPPTGETETNAVRAESTSSPREEFRPTRWFRWHLVAALALFFASAFAAYALVGTIPIEQLEALLGDVQAELPNDGPLPELAFVPLLVNNLRALLLIGLGAVTGGALSVFGLVVNGALVGAVVSFAVRQTSWAIVLAALLPHGVLELPAFFMAASIGLRVPHRVLRWLLGWDETPLSRVEFVELAVISVLLAAMIAVAAWIEVNVTLDVVEWVAGDGALDPVNA